MYSFCLYGQIPALLHFQEPLRINENQINLNNLHTNIRSLLITVHKR
jgi:hypothetical protein